MKSLQQTDPAIYQLIQREHTRQAQGLELIASENIAFPAVCEAVGSTLTNKYAEGYVGKRYYAGCAVVDELETLAIERAKSLFQAGYANVQTHSGSQANMAVYMALLKPGDRILGMDLYSGGHLTHGSPVSFSGKWFEAHGYGVNPDSYRIDYDAVREKARACRPHLIIAGTSSYARVLDYQAFRAIADEVGAYLMVDMAHIAGLIAAGLHPSPVPYADVVTSTTHKTLRGPRGGLIVARDMTHAADVNRAVFPTLQGGPLMHVIAGKAVCFALASTPEYAAYQKQVILNAQALAEALKERGFAILTGGTDTHLFTVDLRPVSMTGAEAEGILEAASITVNKNTIPADPAPPAVTSGIRLGTPFLSARGMKEAEMVQIAGIIADLLHSKGASDSRERALQHIHQLTEQYPIL